LKIWFRSDLSFQIWQNPAPVGLEQNKSGTALKPMKQFKLQYANMHECSGYISESQANRLT